MAFDGELFDDLKRHFSYRRNVEKKDDKKIADLTKEFVKFLKDGASNDEFSALILQYGTGGGGKTAGAFIISTILMASDAKRKLALWQTPPALEEVIKKKLIYYMGEEKGMQWASRVRTITFTNEIEENDIVLIDEGVISMNAKDALTNDAKQFEKFITGARHVRVVIIVNSISLGVIKAYRMMAHVEIYKLMTKKTLKGIESDFLKDNIEKVMMLEPWESLLESCHKKWKNKEGYINLKLSDYCPWFDGEVSKSLASVGSGDFTVSKDKQIEVMIEDISGKAIEFFADKEPKLWANSRVVRAWLRKHHYEQWREIGTRARDILDTIKLKMVEAGEDIDISDEEPESLTADEYERIMEEPDREFEENGDSSPGEAMAHYFFQKAMESGYNRQQAFIAYYTVKGYGLQDMAELATIGLSESYITQIRKDMSEKWFGFWAEWWFAKLIDEPANISAMQPGVPDLITSKPTEYKGHRFETGTIFTIKFRVQRRNVETFYQNGGVNNQLEPNFTPEFLKASEEGKPYYFAFFNPKWSGDHYFIREIDPNDEIVVTVEKPSTDNVMI